jgi:hypothetical protein
MWRYWPLHPTRVDRKLRLPSQQPLDACRPRRGYIGALLHVRQRARHGDRFDLERPSFLGYLGRSQRPADTTKARFQFRFSRCMIGGRGEFRLVCILAKTLRPRSNRVVTNNTWRRQNFSWSLARPVRSFPFGRDRGAYRSFFKRAGITEAFSWDYAAPSRHRRDCRTVF